MLEKQIQSRLVIAVILSFFAGLVVATFTEFRVFFPELLRGAWVTIQVTLGGALVAIAAALMAAAAKMYGAGLFRWLTIVYIEVFRGTSTLVQLFWMFFVLPYFGVTLPPLAVGIAVLGLNMGAYGAEVIRGSILSIDRGQWEVATALNLTRMQTLRRIILPQAFVVMIPPWGNLFIELLKGTALVSMISLGDLTYKAQQLNQNTLRTVEIFSIVLIMYLCMSMIITALMRVLERHVSKGLARGRAS